MTPAPALLLSAGRGERMRPLTDHTPKPLLEVGEKPLLQWHFDALRLAGVTRVVINTAWLAPKIHAFFHKLQASQTPEYPENLLNQGNLQPGSALSFGGCEVLFSDEQRDFGHALETAGGIARALPLLFPTKSKADIFWVVAADAYVPGFSFDMHHVERFMASDYLAHLWLVANPPHHPEGDFGLSEDGVALNLPALSWQPGGAPQTVTHRKKTDTRYTYSSIGLFRAELFGAPWLDIPITNPEGCSAPLAPVLRRAMDAGRVSAEVYDGAWTDVGTPDRLATINTNSASP